MDLGHDAQPPVRHPGTSAGRMRYDDGEIVGSDPDIVEMFDESADGD